MLFEANHNSSSSRLFETLASALLTFQNQSFQYMFVFQIQSSKGGAFSGQYLIETK